VLQHHKNIVVIIGFYQIIKLITNLLSPYTALKPLLLQQNQNNIYKYLLDKLPDALLLIFAVKLYRK
jgi:hypothetical protein